MEENKPEKQLSVKDLTENQSVTFVANGEHHIGLYKL